MRRVRTGEATLNGHGHYVFYAVDYQRPVDRAALVITDGPSRGWWWFHGPR